MGGGEAEAFEPVLKELCWARSAEAGVERSSPLPKPRILLPLRKQPAGVKPLYPIGRLRKNASLEAEAFLDQARAVLERANQEAEQHHRSRPGRRPSRNWSRPASAARPRARRRCSRPRPSSAREPRSSNFTNDSPKRSPAPRSASHARCSRSSSSRAPSRSPEADRPGAGPRAVAHAAARQCSPAPVGPGDGVRPPRRAGRASARVGGRWTWWRTNRLGRATW